MRGHPVDCSCGGNDRSGGIILCDYCATLKHTSCEALNDSDVAALENSPYKCRTCADKLRLKSHSSAQPIKGARYDGEDWRVAVVWYERAGDDDERLAFREPPSDAGVYFSTALNSASLCWVAVGALR